MTMGIISSVCALVLAYFVTRRVMRARPRIEHTKASVRDAMCAKIHAVRPEDSLGEAAQWLVETGQHPLPIVDHGRTVGVLTRCDVATGIKHAGAGARVSTAPHHGAIVVAPRDSVEGVAAQLSHQPDAIAVVMDGEAAVGILTSEQLATYVALHAR
jgi:predicted transcriptional regulator